MSANKFHQVFHCLQYLHLEALKRNMYTELKIVSLEALKRNMMYTELKIESLREHAMKIISFKKKKMNSVTKVNRMKLQKSVIFVKKNMKINI